MELCEVFLQPWPSPLLPLVRLSWLQPHSSGLGTVIHDQGTHTPHSLHCPMYGCVVM